MLVHTCTHMGGLGQRRTERGRVRAGSGEVQITRRVDLFMHGFDHIEQSYWGEVITGAPLPFCRRRMSWACNHHCWERVHRGNTAPYSMNSSCIQHAFIMHTVCIHQLVVEQTTTMLHKGKSFCVRVCVCLCVCVCCVYVFVYV